MRIRVIEWQYEDELTKESMYDALHSLSRVDGVRLFPKKVETTEIPLGEDDIVNILLEHRAQRPTKEYGMLDVITMDQMPAVARAILNKIKEWRWYD